MDDDFAGIVDGLLLEVPDDLPDYTSFTNFELMSALYKIRKDLMDRGVIILPVDSEDMIKQSTYYGLFWEMKRRKLV